MKSNKIALILIFLILLITITTISGSDQLDLKTLEGDWEGDGTFLVPGLNTLMEISGNANFEYIDEKNYLRTALTGEKFLFTYSDSGHLALDNNSDSLTWEVWDNLGRHAKYRGYKNDNKIEGSRVYKKKNYFMKIELVHIDTIDFRLYIKEKDNSERDQATFKLHRIK